MLNQVKKYSLFQTQVIHSFKLNILNLIFTLQLININFDMYSTPCFWIHVVSNFCPTHFSSLFAHIVRFRIIQLLMVSRTHHVGSCPSTFCIWCSFWLVVMLPSPGSLPTICLSPKIRSQPLCSLCHLSPFVPSPVLPRPYTATVYAAFAPPELWGGDLCYCLLRWTNSKHIGIHKNVYSIHFLISETSFSRVCSNIWIHMFSTWPLMLTY